MHHGLSAYVTYQMKADSTEATGTKKGSSYEILSSLLIHSVEKRWKRSNISEATF